MKELSESPVLREWAERKQAGTATVFWFIEVVMPEVTRLLHDGHLQAETTEESIMLRPVEGGRVRYPVPDTMPDAAELLSHIVLSGGIDFGREWWDEGELSGVSADGNVAPDWELKVTYGVPGETDLVEGVINAATLAQAVMRIASGAANLSSEFVTQCKLLAAGNLDAVDIDAEIGDAIMQVAITGDSADYS